MARWQGLAAFVVGNKRYKAGTTYADTSGNALPGDVVYAPFGTAGGLSPMLNPLDAAAIALKGGSPFASSTIPCTITGANSIDG
jgi:hypothetical protein